MKTQKESDFILALMSAVARVIKLTEDERERPFIMKHVMDVSRGEVGLVDLVPTERQGCSSPSTHPIFSAVENLAHNYRKPMDSLVFLHDQAFLRQAVEHARDKGAVTGH